MPHAMPTNPRIYPASDRVPLAALFILLSALTVGWFAYVPGMGGTYHFDDQANLDGLVFVDDAASGWAYVTSGVAGPLGRPLSLASFAIQASAWPNTPQDLLRTNILIHLFNGTLMFLLFFALGRACGQDHRQAGMIAVITGALWMLLPILASSSLFIVQRMTTLSATFALIGAIAYLLARSRLNTRPLPALTGMSIALMLGTTAAALAKENGILLIGYLLVVELTLLPRPRINPTVWRSWMAIFLAIPMVLITAYLATRLPYSESVMLRRDFSGLERLLTQARVLWQYLYLSFLPHPAGLGPFHDNYVVSRSLIEPATLTAVSGWIAVVAMAITVRRRWPVFSFAVAWYLVGHSLESTTLALELYFEHRNYLPVAGPVYALTYAVYVLSRSRPRLAFGSFAAYIAVLSVVLTGVTSLWGNPSLAAEMWHIHKPDSMRATQFLAQRLQSDGDPHTSRRVLARFVDQKPDAHGVQLQILQMDCALTPEVDHADRVQTLANDLRTARFHHGVQESLALLYNQVTGNRCKGVDQDSIKTINRALLDNPGFTHSRTTHHNLHVLMARLGIDRRDLDMTMRHMETALEIHPNPQTLLLAVQILNSAGLHQAALALIAQGSEWMVRNPLVRWTWERELSRLEEAQLSVITGHTVRSIDRH